MDKIAPVSEVPLENSNIVIPESSFEALQDAPQHSLIQVETRLDSYLRSSLPSWYEDRTCPLAQPHILQALLSEQNIRDLLTEKLCEEQVETLIERICGRPGQRRIVILAILILVRHSALIKDIVNEGISDEDLPLVFDNASDPRFTHMNNSNQTLVCFNEMPPYIRGLIDRFQWSLRTPFMEMKGPDFKPYKQTFDDKTVLPWTWIKRRGQMVEFGQTERIGGYSTIYHCHIDDRFHGFGKVLEKVGLAEGKGEFALREVIPNSPSENDIIERRYENIEKQLYNSNGTIHRHLVTLLATFTFKENRKFYFLFPWGESNLFTYWETQQNPDARWVSVQLAGLVDALAKIHISSHLPNLFRHHGAMTPDNILWFTPCGKDTRGTLVISHMGFATVHTASSRFNPSDGKPRTPEYRAPDSDVTGSPVPHQSDIWPLGCIFLEMMVWLVGGNSFVKEFRQARNTVAIDGTITPTFFGVMIEGGKQMPIVKPEVIEWVGKIESHENTTQFIYDVVQVIKSKMIRPLASQRGTISGLQYEFDMINKECQKHGDSSYYMLRRPQDNGTEANSGGTNQDESSPDKSISNPTEISPAVESYSLVFSQTTEAKEWTRTAGTESAAESSMTSLAAPSRSTSMVGSVKDSGHEIFSPSLGVLAASDFTEYSNSNLPLSVRENYVEHFANELLNGLLSDLPGFESLERVSKTLKENLKGFASRLGLNNNKKTELDIVHFTHKHRSEIGEAFDSLLEDLRRRNAQLDWKEKEPNVEMWLEGQEESFELQSAESLPSDFDANRYNHFDGKVHNDETAVADPAESSEEREIYRRFLEYHGTVVETVAYAWLVKTLHRDALSQPLAENQDRIRIIREEILRSFPNAKISRKLPSKVYMVKFVLDWDPWVFAENREPSELPEQALLGAITLTGSLHDAQALTLSEYLHQTWPLNGANIIQLLRKLMRSKSEVGCSEVLADGTVVTAIHRSGNTIFTAAGVADSIAEVGQQLAWIGAALQPVPKDSESGLFQCCPSITMKRSQKETEKERTFGLAFHLEALRNMTDTPGSCWHNMLRNAVLVTGFPIRSKPLPNSGIEMPLDIMACLTGSRRVIEFDGKVILNGFSTMLTVVERRADVLNWHYTFRADGKRIPFFAAVAPKSKDIHLGLLETSRHVIGWCSSARYHTGDPQAEHDIQETGLPEPSSGFLLDRVTLCGGKGISISASIAVAANKKRPQHVTSNVYTERIIRLSEKFVLMWDDMDKRGWLVDGASALLHLVRARLKVLSSDCRWNSILKLDVSKMTEAVERYHPANSAAEVLLDQNNRALKVWAGSTDSNTEKQNHVLFEGFVEEMMSYLEQIIDYQTELASRSGKELKIHARRHLEGWDFADFTHSRAAKPRIAEVKSWGWGWVDFVRSINAVALFGRGYGNLITPAEGQHLCPKWHSLPTDGYYLAASVQDLRRAMKGHGSQWSSPQQLVHGYYWHSPPACSCNGPGDVGKKHRNPVQLILPMACKWIPKFVMEIKGPISLDQQNERAAFIFGHNSDNPIYWGLDGDDLQVSKKKTSNYSHIPASQAQEHRTHTPDDSSSSSHMVGSSISAQRDVTSISSLESPLSNTPGFSRMAASSPLSASHFRFFTIAFWRKRRRGK